MLQGGGHCPATWQAWQRHAIKSGLGGRGVGFRTSVVAGRDVQRFPVGHRGAAGEQPCAEGISWPLPLETSLSALYVHSRVSLEAVQGLGLGCGVSQETRAGLERPYIERPLGDLCFR